MYTTWLLLPHNERTLFAFLLDRTCPSALLACQHLLFVDLLAVASGPISSSHSNLPIVTNLLKYLKSSSVHGEEPSIRRLPSKIFKRGKKKDEKPRVAVHPKYFRSKEKKICLSFMPGPLTLGLTPTGGGIIGESQMLSSNSAKHLF